MGRADDFGRVGQGPPITLLELETGAIIACSLFTFFFWYNKLMDLTEPTKLHANTSIAKILIRAGDEAKKPYSRTPLDFVEYVDTLSGMIGPKERPISRIAEDRDVLADNWWIHWLFDLPSLPIITIQLLGWIFTFPTRAEQQVWRYSCVAYSAILIPYGPTETFAQAFEKEPKTFVQRLGEYKRKWPHQILFWIPITLAAFVRMCVSIEVFINMRALARGCYYNVEWSEYMPHIS